jgi:hypothetical protein
LAAAWTWNCGCFFKAEFRLATHSHSLESTVQSAAAAESGD